MEGLGRRGMEGERDAGDLGRGEAVRAVPLDWNIDSVLHDILQPTFPRRLALQTRDFEYP